MDPLFEIPEDITVLTDDELNAFIDATLAKFAEINEAPASFVGDDRTTEDLIAEMDAAREAVVAARAELATRAETAAVSETDEPVEGDEPVEAEAADDDFAAVHELASSLSETEDESADDDPDGDDDDDDEPAAEAAVVEPEPVVAAAAPIVAPPARRPSRSRASAPQAAPQETRTPVSLTASAGGLGYDIGGSIPGGMELAEMMIRRRKDFGRIAKGTKGEKIPIAQLDWRDAYGDDRILSDGDGNGNMSKIYSVIDPDKIRMEFNRRKDGALTASGGLCAPVTPYYQLAMISSADRPVRAALPSFNADRGGIRYGRPASLSSVTTGVGVRTAAEDEAGGTEAVKTCQVVDCPDFDEADVSIIYHCLQFGNLGARTFPERVTQWNNLVLAAHARLAESTLLTEMHALSTKVEGNALGLGASATLPSQILTAAAAIRSRNRMADDAILRVMLPTWVLDLLVSDVYRSQFQRFDMTGPAFIALLRAGNVEPSFYKDGAVGTAQIFGTQPDLDGLLPFPANVVWYIFPEGSFLYLDGGVLELGIVRDSVLNETNDFQIFGETFENLAFIGIESMVVTTPVCDSGTVSLPDNVACPISYAT